MVTLAVDFMNQAHRARSGFQAGPAPVVFNFFKSFRATVEQFKPDRVIVVLEGKPVRRYEMLGEYKATRRVEPDAPRAAELARFFEQVDVIKDLLVSSFPVEVVRHPTSECDDTIANLVRAGKGEEWIIVSNDSDFTQLLQEGLNVGVWNPMKKEFVVPPSDYDYVTWKALRGDGSDNIPGVPGVGDKTAAKLASDPSLLREFVSRPEVEPIFTRNYNLIRFMEWTDDETRAVTRSPSSANFDVVKERFEGYGFQSITKEGAWEKFTSTFSRLEVA